MAELPTVQFDAELRQLRTMADGSCNLILNIPEYELGKAQVMLGWLKDAVTVAIVNPDSKE